jgi:hypothetical protein
VGQRHTGRLTGFWFLLDRPKGWILMNEWISLRIRERNNLRSHLMKPNVIRLVVCDLILSTNISTTHLCVTLYNVYFILCTFYLLTAYFISHNIIQRNAFRYFFSSLLFEKWYRHSLFTVMYIYIFYVTVHVYKSTAYWFWGWSL